MKKAMIWPHTHPPEYRPAALVKGWLIDGVWSCYKDETTKLPWVLVHSPSGMWVCFAEKKEHCQILADEFNAVGDWSEGVPATLADTVHRTYNRAKAKCALLDAEKALAREEKKREEHAEAGS